jgi:dTDP-4-amino-4,6-dideoxygalactose transaminase
LHPRKVITTGEGGMIAVSDPALAERLRLLRQHGMSVSDLARHAADDVIIETYPVRGHNARMTDMQAALGLCQLAVLDEILERRRALAARYTAALRSVPALEAPFEPPESTRTWQSYCVRVTPRSPLGRTEIMRRLLRDGIATRRGVMTIHEEPAYAAGGVSLPQSEAVARDTLMLPLFPDLSEADQDFVIARLTEHVRVLAA